MSFFWFECLRQLLYHVSMYLMTVVIIMFKKKYTQLLLQWMQGCGNIEPTTGHLDLFAPFLSCFPYTWYTAQF